MDTDIGTTLLADAAFVYRQQRRLAEGAVEQVDDQAFFHAADQYANSIAVIMKHVGGNLRSRWTDFLTTDGEKPDRNRDGEFSVDGESRADVIRTWNEGWERLEGTLAALQPADLARTVTIRGEEHTVIQALIRNLAHASHHAGQIVMAAKELAGENWQTLSIPRGGSTGVPGSFWVGRR
jgi:hypothetical protein